MAKTTLVVCILVLVAGTTIWAQQKPASLILNGGYERMGGWNKPAAAQPVAAQPAGRCMRLTGAGGIIQDVMVDEPGETYSCSLRIKTNGVVPAQGGGFAYAAIYQLNAAGKWIEFHDFITLTGDNDWKRYDFTFDLVPGAETISVRCGIHNASGTAWFDDWTLVRGPTALSYEETIPMGEGQTRAGGAVAVFREEGFPVKGVASSPERLGKLLADAGLHVEYLSADDLGDPAKLNSSRFNILLLPYGQSFPAPGRKNTIRFLRNGGSFISMGGYVFNNLLTRHEGEWVDEARFIQQKLAEALERSALADGSFEQTAEAPIGGMQLDGKWRRDGDICTVVQTQPKHGQHCAQITVTADAPREDRWYLDITPKRGARYQVSGWVRTEGVEALGNGFAYMAVYEYGADGELGPWRDFATVTGTTEWQRFTYDFTPSAGTQRLHLKAGLYRAVGTAWFDDIRLSDISGIQARPMNTSTGEPKDGLVVAPAQIGAFDADFRLRRAVKALPGALQHIFAPGAESVGELSGWAAAGVQGYDNARWVELLDARDRFGRKRGAAGALMINYNGFYGGSMWGYFGAENRDLFDGASPAMDDGLARLAKFMVNGLFLRNLETDNAAYEPGEPGSLSVHVQNNGLEARECAILFELHTGAGETPPLAYPVSITVPASSAQVARAHWPAGALKSDLCRATARLLVADRPIDEMQTGFVVRDDQVARSGPELRFHDNYFHLNGQPIFLFGSDTYGNVYKSGTENPWTWGLDHGAARDFGFNVYENLQFSNADYTFSPHEWGQFEGMAQLCQRNGLVFMPCQLVGHNVAIDDQLLEKQAGQCAAYGEHMAQYPGLLYYLNGDFRLQHTDKQTLMELWNQWLADKYHAAEGLKASWGEEQYGDWGELAYPPPGPKSWDSARECDRARFEVWLTTRWVRRHVRAVRNADPEHPITSEYYQQPHGGLDLILTIDGQDASNIGYFRGRHDDVTYLPLSLRLNDLRMRGKSLGLGEYGVKTHPAWGPDNGAVGYHPMRTEEEQKRLFMAVAHYGFAMGACKVQNWCLRDASESVFPWGVFYPNGRIPKDVAYWHRNLSLVWRHFRPVYEPPAAAVLLPDNMRLGANQQSGIDIAFNSFNALMAMHVDFSVINEHHIDALTDATKTLIWPSPFCPDDACYNKVLQWVKAGGRLIVSGDISLNWDRKRTRGARLEELCGVQFVKRVYGPPARDPGPAQESSCSLGPLRVKPCVQVKPAGATVLGATPAGDPVRFVNSVGKGVVVYCTDPVEMGRMSQVTPDLILHYRCAITYDGVEGLEAPRGETPDLLQDIHKCRQPLRSGGEFTMAFNTHMPPGSRDVTLPAGDADVRVRVAARYPAMTATDGQQRLVAVGCSGQATLDGQEILRGDAQVICLALDGKALNLSDEVLLCPFSTGKTELLTREHWEDPVTLVGDIIDGQWVTYETIAGKSPIDLDEDTMTCLFLICERDGQQEATSKITLAMQHPDQTRGY